MSTSYSILRVDLTKGQCESERIPEVWLKSFIGGKGLGVAYMYKELEPGTDPLSPENRLIFMLGPLSGIAPGCSRYCLVTKSPQTGAILHSYSGGFFPAELRNALPKDHLGVIVQGRAAGLVALKIEDGSVELVETPELKSKTNSEVYNHFSGFKVAAIGPAGENLVTYATIGTDKGTHQAGRGGAGAVMGAKNLKAVAVQGERPAFAEEIKRLQKEELKRLSTSDRTKGHREGGTPRIVDMTNETGTLPTRNWTKGSFENSENINVTAMQRNVRKRVSCYQCPIACGFSLELSEGAYEGLCTEKGPEYETLGMLGANLEIGDLSAVAKLSELCNEVGIDTISAGNVIGWVMESSERGLIDYKIGFGDHEKAAELIELIAKREDIGDLVAEGTKRAAMRLGGDALGTAVEVKGLEPPAYEPRGSHSMGLAYATSDRGACHMRAWAIGGDVFGDRDPYVAQKEHADGVIAQQNSSSIIPDSLVSCAFAGYTVENAVAWLNALGYEVDEDSLALAGERIWNLTRLFNNREGFSRKDDSLPARMQQPLQNAGPATGKVLPTKNLEKMLDWYYEGRGWSREGVPSQEKLQSLGLDSWR